MTAIAKLQIDKVRLDGGTQSRAQLSDDTIADYAETYSRKDGGMPPVVVFYDGEMYWLADGFHRIHAAQKAGRHKIDAEVHQGSQRDAVLYSVGANDKHGLRRTNADKRRAVTLLLKDDEWGAETSRWVATKCGVSHTFVEKLRDELATVANSGSGRRTGKDGKSYQSSKPERTGQDGKVRKLPERAGRKAHLETTPEEDAAIAEELERQRGERAPRDPSNVVSLARAIERVEGFDARSEANKVARFLADVLSSWPADADLDPLVVVLDCWLGNVSDLRETRRGKAL